jgi:hypothetical protein
MLLAFPTCTWKCGREHCQNYDLITAPDIVVDVNELVMRFMENPISEAIVLGGLEPMDSFDDVCKFITALRRVSSAMVVIQTGYTQDEVRDKLLVLMKRYTNITMKFGRYIPNDTLTWDGELGIHLASQNQYGVIMI